MIMLIRSPAIAEKADRTVLSRTATQHSNDGYYRRGIFLRFPCLQYVLMYVPDGINEYG